MIGYEKSTLERQSFGSKNWQRFSNLPQVCLQILEKFKNDVPQCKIVRNLMFKFNYTSSSSKISENQGHQNQNWTSVVFRPSGSTALKTDIILSWNSLHGLRNTSRNHCQ